MVSSIIECNMHKTPHFCVIDMKISIGISLLDVVCIISMNKAPRFVALVGQRYSGVCMYTVVCWCVQVYSSVLVCFSFRAISLVIVLFSYFFLGDFFPSDFFWGFFLYMLVCACVEQRVGVSKRETHQLWCLTFRLLLCYVSYITALCTRIL